MRDCKKGQFGPLPQADGTAEVNKTHIGGGVYEFNEAPAWSEPLVLAYTAQEVAAERNQLCATLKLAMQHSAWGGTLQLDDALLNIDDALNQQLEPVTQDNTTWSLYVAGMIGCYLKWPADDERIEAVGGIIERRIQQARKVTGA